MNYCPVETQQVLYIQDGDYFNIIFIVKQNQQKYPFFTALFLQQSFNNLHYKDSSAMSFSFMSFFLFPTNRIWNFEKVQVKNEQQRMMQIWEQKVYDSQYRLAIKSLNYNKNSIINIQMLGIELTEKQAKIWGEMGDQMAATPDIRHLALQYYLQYRENLSKNKLDSDEHDKISNLVHIAYFISEKNQVTFNMKGERVIGIALSINEIIKKNNNFEDFIFHMKEMLKVITIEDKHVEQQIQNCLKKFKFTMTFHHKFASTFKKIKPVSSHLQFAQSLLWLIFILIKQNATTQSQNDIIDITCLIAAVFVFYVEECVKASGMEFELDDANYGGALRKQSITHVFLEYFRLKDINKYQQVLSFFKDQLQQLKDKTGFDTFFNQRNIEHVYKRVDGIYMKKLSDDNIDERHFLKERINTVLNANRFTPFGGRRFANANRSKNTSAPNQILSHRVLNYQKQSQDKSKPLSTDNQQANQAISRNGSILLKKLVQNQTPCQKTPLIKATPMTNAMEMYNWVLQKSNYHKLNVNELNKYLKGEQKTLKLINGLWKDVCLNEEDKQIQLSEKDKLAILALSAQIAYFVTNSNENIDKLINTLQITWFDVWTKIDSLLSYDNRMPVTIKIHLLSLDTLLISKQLWKTEQSYAAIFKQAKARSEKTDFDRLYRRVIHQIVYQIFFLCKRLNIGEDQMNSIFLLCQYAICQFTELLIRRNLYHIIVCSVFAVSRAQQLGVSLCAVLIAFKQLNNLEKEDFHELTEQIFYQEDQEEVDLINFYNLEFVPKTKAILRKLKYEAGNAISSMPNRKNLISSPVKDLLPKNVIALGDRTNKTPLHTPFTMALQAYHESPLLKQKKIKNLANYIDGKRILQKKNEFSKQESLKQTSMLINQKWRNTKSPEQKLNTTVKKGSSNQNQ